jgi:hypothetical protein
MFFKRPSVQLLNWGSVRETAWDDETVKWIAQRDQLDVRVTHVLKTVSLGMKPYRYRSDDRSEWSVHGKSAKLLLIARERDVSPV